MDSPRPYASIGIDVGILESANITGSGTIYFKSEFTGNEASQDMTNVSTSKNDLLSIMRFGTRQQVCPFQYLQLPLSGLAVIFVMVLWTPPVFVHNMGL
jgi:hypothetical protein